MTVNNSLFPNLDIAMYGNNFRTNTSSPIFTNYSYNNPYSSLGSTYTSPATSSSWWNDFNSWVNDNFKDGWMDFGKFGLGALQTGMGIYSGLKQLGLAQDQFNFTKDAFNTNLANSIKSYNNALEDRARSRYAYMTGDASNADDYINQHKL